MSGAADQGGNVIPVRITDEVRSSFINYAMSVIVDRALPDVRDGLKPVQRRILYAMLQEGLASNRRYSKSAGVVGEVIKKYHPHGDQPIYDAMVRMAQPWNVRYLLVDGQGNFGSIDGDPPAAYRYTEARLTKFAESVLADIDKETVAFRANFDDSTTEPEVLPSAVPNLLVNGATGIAVGMAANLPPHNLGEVVDALIARIDDPGISLDQVMAFLPGPDFPTGGRLGRQGIKEAYATGQGALRVRGKVRIEEKNGRTAIVIAEIPYQVNKTNLITTIAGLVRAGRIDEISNLRDESDRHGMRIVVELRKNASHELVLNQLYKFTQLQSTFNAIMIAIVDGQPRVLPLVEAMRLYLEHRKVVVTRRSRYELRRAQERSHVLEGLLVAQAGIDEVIALIRASQSGAEARERLVTQFDLTEIQAQAILDMRLQRLTALERDRIAAEHRALQNVIGELLAILGDERRLMQVIRGELAAAKAQFADPRRTDIGDLSGEISKEDLIAEEECVITMTSGGYIKRTALDAYRRQGRGGRGVFAGDIRDEDYTTHLFIGNTHHYLLFFTNQGRVYRQKIYEIVETERFARGQHIKNILALHEEERVWSIVAVPDLDRDTYLLCATRHGIVKKTALREYQNMHSGGIIAINLDEGDELVGVAETSGRDEVILATAKGQAIRFPEAGVRPTGRATRGMIGIRLRDGDRVISLSRVPEGQPDLELLTISKKGLGKRTPLEEYRVQSRGGTGIKTLEVTAKTGELVRFSLVAGDEELMVLSEQGVVIRTRVKGIRLTGRATQGVRIIKLGAGDSVASTALVQANDRVLGGDAPPAAEVNPA